MITSRFRPPFAAHHSAVLALIALLAGILTSPASADGRWWNGIIRYFVPAAALALLVWWFTLSATVYAPADWYNPFNPFSVMTVLVQWGLVIGILATLAMWLLETLLEDGALYHALHRMEARGWLESDWGISEKGRKAKYYRLSAKGTRALATEERQWARYVEAVAKITPRASES